MPDWGTFIADSKGILHDVTKTAFDAYHQKSTDRPLNASNPLLRDGFQNVVSVFKEKIQKKLGVDPEAGLSLEEIGGQMQKQLLAAGSRMALETAAGYGLKYAADLEGPLGLLLSEALTIVTSEITFALTKGEQYLPGQWVFLDCGLKTRMINSIPKVIELASQFDVFSANTVGVVPEDLDYSTEAKHAIGFILGQEDSGYEWSVFSFYTGKEEKIHEDKLRPCPRPFAEKLDNDPDFSQVREVLFVKEHDPTLQSYVPTEPGQQVFYKGKPFFILEQAGEEYEIIGANGETVQCKVTDLVAGKTETSQKWNHDEIALGHYRQDGLFSGEWVWVTANDLVDKLMQPSRRKLGAVDGVPDALRNIQADNMVLAMVETIEGSTVHLSRAYDGQKIDKRFGDVFPASDRVQGLLDRDKACGNWKLRVLEGGSSTEITPGSTHPLLTLGLGEASQEELSALRGPEEQKPPLVSGGVSSGRSQLADIQEDIDRQDLANEVQLLADTPVTAESFSKQQKETSEAGPSSGSMMLVVGAIAIWMLYT